MLWLWNDPSLFFNMLYILRTIKSWAKLKHLTSFFFPVALIYMHGYINKDTTWLFMNVLLKECQKCELHVIYSVSLCFHHKIWSNNISVGHGSLQLLQWPLLPGQNFSSFFFYLHQLLSTITFWYSHKYLTCQNDSQKHKLCNRFPRS